MLYPKELPPLKLDGPWEDGTKWLELYLISQGYDIDELIKEFADED